VQREKFSLEIGVFNIFAPSKKEQRIAFPPRKEWEAFDPCPENPLIPGNVVPTNIRLDAYVKKFLGVEHGHRLPELSDMYDLFVTKGRGYAWNFIVFSDCEFTVILALKDKGEHHPLACIGFDVSLLWNTITVGQIQGLGTLRTKGKRDKRTTRYLLPLRWEQMLLSLLRDYAKQEGFRTIRVIPARKQTYFCEAREVRFLKRYETTPALLGFSRSWFGYHVYPLWRMK